MSQQINLFNPIFLKQKKHFSAVTMLQALLLIVLGSMLFYGYAMYQVKLLAKQTAEMNVRYEAEQKRLVNYINEFSPQRAQKLLDDELQMVEAQASMQEALLATLKGGAIGNTQGYSEYLRAFARQSVKGLWLTGFNINGDGAQMSLQGAAVNPQLLPAYIQRMNREPVMRGKSFAALQMKLPTSVNSQPVAGYVEFNLKSIAVEEVAK
ncbi:MAG: PilN domain-containing protein [Gammaproteobacteria bacterium]|nr:PilN domain-containing protein [Gammaproteobacteria bacterium]MBU1624776.1 PilN domain-containing protein [Gammaproteobacteria bacterium]MBU1982620.1 PilN domain-containing protein [Gammaproteobacteria bacterium]